MEKITFEQELAMRTEGSLDCYIQGDYIPDNNLETLMLYATMHFQSVANEKGLYTESPTFIWNLNDFLSGALRQYHYYGTEKKVTTSNTMMLAGAIFTEFFIQKMSDDNNSR